MKAGEEVASKERAKVEEPQRRVVIVGKKHGVEGEGERLSVPAQAFCCPWRGFLYLSDEGRVSHSWKSNLSASTAGWMSLSWGG